jgi:flagellar L-ring protein precursor FlgH
MVAATAQAASAADLYSQGSWPALASDRNARAVGDAITIVVYENSTATNAASTSSKKSSSLSGAVNAGSFDKSGGLSFGGGSQGNGSTGRSGQMVAQISAVVEAVLPNGDLQIAGQQELHINGEHTHIRVKGRVRPADISASNAVISSRLADATIDYDGTGFVSRSAKPGIVTRIFNWLGLL